MSLLRIILKLYSFGALLSIVSQLSFVNLTSATPLPQSIDTVDMRRIKIGISTALSGPAATFGEDTQKILLHALARYADAPIEVIVEDDKCSPKDAATVANKLATIDKVDVVIGPVCTGAVLAAAPIYERARILHITPNARSRSLTSRTPWTLAANPGNELPVKAILKHASESSTRMTVLSEVSEFCDDVVSIVSETAESYGLSVTNVEFQADATDVREVVLKSLSSLPEAIFLNVQNEAALVKLLKLVRENKYRGDVFALYYPGGKTFLKLADKYADGIMYSDFRTPLDSPKSKINKIYQDFVAQRGELNSNASNFEYTYDLISALIEAFSTKSDARAYLIAPATTLSGANSTWRFEANRRRDGVVTLKKIAGQSAKLISEEVVQ